MTSLKDHPSRYFFALLAMLVVPLSGVGIDIYVPSLPAVGHYFNVDKSLVQLTITMYMIGLAGMQLFAGSISDSFGRRKPFLIGMFVFLISTLCIPFSQTIYQLLFLRLVQGTMVGMIVVPMRAVAPDLFDGVEYHKMINYMVMAWTIGPIIAPAIGGYLQHYFGWKSCFYFLAGYSFLSFMAVFFFLPETSVHRHPFEIPSILKRFRTILSNLDFLKNVSNNAFLYSIMILFSIVGPFLIQVVLHYSAIQYGHAALMIGLVWFLGSLTNRFIIHIPVETKVNACLWAMLVVALVMVGIALFWHVDFYRIMIPVLLLGWLGGIIFPNCAARAIGLFPEMSGSASAVWGSLTFFISGILSGLGTFLKSNTQLPLAMAYVGLIVVCILMQFVGRKRAI